MKFQVLPTRTELENYAKIVPELNPSSVLAMLRIMRASEKIKANINNVLEKQHHLSEGKLRVMILLHQHPEGVAPSFLAYRAGVTKATISVMLRRMIRDGMVYSIYDTEDGRSKKILLTCQGKNFMEQILPDHYLRISSIMKKLTDKQQDELIWLLTEISD
ncbi:MarR family transcriptional regulator [Megasphaera paucivorans]|uniref:DNA-binding transcriptional regulator, MarR family n=1 Tax=Megasphaera paucivorans TaxID=349095 RepID=A0A1H0AMJ9_9FIRM|nr:MarR family transcriptional regulator [Megasphaera paucivorans]SDN34717.1 DNA-binding transcriptional regulator, MarR family [Megasphaera paucivorans]